MKNIRSFIKNFIIFVLLIVITLMLVFKDKDLSHSINILFNVKLGYVIIAFLCMLIYFILEGYNIKRIIGALGKKVKLFSSVKYTLISFFFSGITPATTGGQPMEVYSMHKEGIPVSYSTVALLVHLCSFQIVTNICGIIGALSNKELLGDGFLYLFIIGFSLNFFALTIMLICLFSNKLARGIVRLFIKFLGIIKYNKISIIEKKINDALDKYSKSAKYILKHKELFIKSLLTVFLQVLLYYSIPYWICKSFGVESNLIRIITMQALLFSSVSSIPLPGAVGVSEGAFLKIYNKVFGEKVLSSAMLLNRFINFYLFILISMVVVLIFFIKIKKKSSILDDYKNVETPEELLEFMDNNIRYGLHGIDGEDYTNDGSKKSNEIFQNACNTVYELASPDYILKYGIGHCWDQVELERDWFLRHGYEFKTIYIMFLLNYQNNYSTHTYLIYKDNDSYCIFEHADANNAGIHRFNSYEEAIRWQRDRHIDINREMGNEINNNILKHLHIFEYNNPKYGINMNEFIDFVLNSEDITNIIEGD